MWTSDQTCSSMEAVRDWEGPCQKREEARKTQAESAALLQLGAGWVEAWEMLLLRQKPRHGCGGPGVQLEGMDFMWRARGTVSTITAWEKVVLTLRNYDGVTIARWFFCLFFQKKCWLHPASCGILVPHPRIGPALPAEKGSLNSWTTGGSVPPSFFLNVAN